VPTESPLPTYRRRSDGMCCRFIPSASVEIGSDGPQALGDEQPKHIVKLDAFYIDAEPVSTTAYCRFLNSVAETDPAVLSTWFILEPDDHRAEHVLVVREDGVWRPLPGVEKWPMILVSWYGANAYSLWANGRDWTDFRDESGAALGSFLPTEAQWEYAARGSSSREFPWGDDPPKDDQMCFGRHRRSATYRADTMPMAAVNSRLGVSPFGLHHMAGNVWQWCRDWYDGEFYRKPESGWRTRSIETVAESAANAAEAGSDRPSYAAVPIVEAGHQRHADAVWGSGA